MSYWIIFPLLLLVFTAQSQTKQATCENSLWYSQPASNWIEALPIGNGRMGAMIFGNPKHERIQLNEDSLWPGGPDWGNSKGTPQDLERYRKLMNEGEISKADKDYMDTFSYGSVTRSHQTMGDLFIDFENNGKVTNYKRSLCLKDALINVDYNIKGDEYSEKIFASNPDDVIAIKLTTTAKKGMSFKLRLERLEDHGRVTATSSNPSNSEISMKGMVTQYNAKKDSKPIVLDHGVKFETRLKINNTGGKVVSKDGVLLVSNVKNATIYLVSKTSFYTKNYKAENSQTLENLKGKTFEELLQRHTQDFNSFFDRVSLDLDDKALDSLPTDVRLDKVRNGATDLGLEAKLFQYGRYLLISSSRPGTNPANLQGIWNKDIEAAWNADYHLNINLQMNYWPSQVTNLSEFELPLLDFADRLLERGKITAKEQYGMKGAVIHHTTDLWAPAWMRAEKPFWGAWIHGGGWLAQHYWEYYQFTQDKNFLKNRAYPFLKANAEFYLDWLQKDPKTGKWISYPETSPENSYYAPDGKPAALSKGTAMGYEIIGEVFDNTLAAAKILNINDSFVREVREKRKNLHKAIVIGDDGRILEWNRPYDEPEKGHRHMSHLYALYPGDDITEDNPKAFKAAQKTMDFRLTNGGGGPGWSRAWLINFNARLLDAASAHKNIKVLFEHSISNNLFNQHPPFQIDGNFGYTAGVAEMLLQSHEGFLRILPALPKQWETGNVKGLKARGNTTVDISWKNGILEELILISTKSQKCSIKYKGKTVEVQLRKNQNITLDKNLVNINQ